MATAADRIMKYWPIGLAIVTVALAAGAGQFQLSAVAAETGENSREIRENADDIDDLERALIERRGDIALELERLRLQQQAQEEKTDEIIDILRSIQIQRP